MEGFFYALKFVYLKYYSYICYMKNRAELIFIMLVGIFIGAGSMYVYYNL